MTDIWNFYLTQEHPEPGIVFLDLGLRADAPLDLLDQSVVMQVELNQVRDNGMPTPDELTRLNELEDYLLESLPDEQVLFIARKTLGGRRDFYFYTANATLAKQLLSQAMVGFSEYEYEIESQLDAEWLVYDELYPNRREVQTMHNHEVIAKLQSSGDELTTSRPVTHWVYFSTYADRAKFCQSLDGTPFRLLHETETIAGRDYPFGQVVEHEGPADIESIDDAALALYDLAIAHDGDYDGWETRIVSDEGKS